ncbi:MAG: hypothetical protein ACK48Y_23660, partial [Planctomyces sp.]
MDVDLVCELVAENVPAFVSAFGDDFYVSELAVRTASQRHSCFSLSHLSTSFKADVFISRGRPFDTSSMDRATLETLEGEPWDGETVIRTLADRTRTFHFAGSQASA